MKAVREELPSAPGNAHRSGVRRRLFRLALATLMPLALIGALELGLRIVGVGYETAFFVREADGLVSNPRFGWRFFPRTISRAPLPVRLALSKPGHTVRIFVLGASAAQGYPDPAFGFGRILETMLREELPGTRFEVINTAMTAINSHVVVPIARDCAGLQPDLFIVYLGNNEVIGPYGPGTSLLGFQPDLSVIRVGSWLETTRLGQLLRKLAGAVRGDGEPLQWAGMEMFARNRVAASDPRLERTYAHFGNNLRSICDVARDAGARVILCTVAVNLRQCPPFVSMHGSELSESDLRRWQRWFDKGVSCRQEGDGAGAIAAYRQALAIDETYAELHFRLALSLLGSGDVAAAREQFSLARDQDALRFRADSRLNGVIRDVARERRDLGVSLLDVETLFSESPRVPDGIPGDEFFYEHVHLSFEGNYELACALWPVVVESLPGDVASGASHSTPLSLDECRERLAFTDFDLEKAQALVWAVITRPPFAGQAMHETLVARNLARREAVWAGGISLDRVLGVYERALQRNPSDPWLLATMGAVRDARGEHEKAIAVYRRLCRVLPNDVRAYLGLGSALLSSGDIAAAQRAFERYVEGALHHYNAYRKVILAFADHEQLDQARAWCRRALECQPDNPMLLCALADVESRAGALDEAAAVLKRALERDDRLAETWLRLGTLKAARSQRAESIEALERARALDPFMAGAYQGLAVVYMRSGDDVKATEALEKAAGLAPDNVDMIEELARRRRRAGRVDQAVRLLRRVLLLEPTRATATSSLAWILATTADASLRDPGQALRLARRVSRSARGEQTDTLLTLSAALAASGDFERAVDVATRAHGQALNEGNTRLAQKISGYLGLYRAHRPLMLRPSNGREKR